MTRILLSVLGHITHIKAGKCPTEWQKMILRTGRPVYRKIELQTRERNDIDNSQDIDATICASFTYSKSVTARNGPNQYYNCHGLTFASSRTWVLPKEISMILKDDGYTEVIGEQVLPGDVILYYDNNEEISHSGIVVSKISGGQFGSPWVVSKWGHLAEVYHLAFDVPNQYKPIERMSYWRINK